MTTATATRYTPTTDAEQIALDKFVRRGSTGEDAYHAFLQGFTANPANSIPNADEFDALYLRFASVEKKLPQEHAEPREAFVAGYRVTL
jgi:hypothetical protein